MKTIDSIRALFAANIIFASASISLLLPACGNERDSDLKIIGGTEVTPDDKITHSVAALVNAAGVVKCTVAPISSDIFITAAHCVYGRDDFRDWSIVTGTDVLSGYSYSVDAVAVHNNFSAQSLSVFDPEVAPNDIALIRTIKPVQGTIPVPIIRDLGGIGTAPAMSVIVAGYGRSTGNDPNSKGTLRKTLLTITSRNTLAHEFTADDSTGRMGCHGDSGGPAFAEIKGRLYLAGIVSRGDTSCLKGKTIFTDAAFFSDFIAHSRDTLSSAQN